jgi:hypothetical protein
MRPDSNPTPKRRTPSDYTKISGIYGLTSYQGEGKMGSIPSPSLAAEAALFGTSEAKSALFKENGDGNYLANV